MNRLIYILCNLILLAACTKQEETPTGVPEGRVEIHPSLPGMLTASPTAGTRAGDFVADGKLLAGKEPIPLDEGATMWLLVEGTTEDGSAYKTLKPYVVKGKGDMQTLHPCTVDNEGKVEEEDVAPLYIPYGTYTFRGLSPARAFLDGNGNPITDLSKVDTYRQLVKNGDYLISTDERYEQTKTEPQTIAEGSGKVQLIELKPLINQTAQLKFTIYADPENTYIHSITMMSAGVEISGLQDWYEQDQNLWNWSPAVKDTLRAYPGNKHQRLVLHGDDTKSITHKSDKEIEVRAAALPTDATSSSIIVLFNMEVNGVPTQYEMMLNQKILRAAFSYHYKGKVTVQNGIVAIEWQHVSWSTDVEIEI